MIGREAMMLPYSLWFISTWNVFLLAYSWIGLPLGIQASHSYP